MKHGILNCLPETLILQFEITPAMKTHVKRVLGHLKRIIQDEELPPIWVANINVTANADTKNMPTIKYIINLTHFL